MGTEFVRSCMKEDYMEVPPGFESLFPITHMKAGDYKVDNTSSVAAVESHHVDLKDEPRMTKSLRQRHGIQYYQFDDWSGDQYEYEQVMPKWHPGEARRPDLEDAPVFYPSEEEFEDTLKYISSIRPKAEAYGICRIVPPLSWKPPCPLKEKNVWEGSKFATRSQRIDKLQNRSSTKKILRANHSKKRKRRRCMKNDDSESSHGEDDASGEDEAESFGFEPGPDFTLDSFQKYADHFMMQYFNKRRHTSGVACSKGAPEQWQPSYEEIEGEYWRMVEEPTEEIEVLYGADVETAVFGSGFPKIAQQVLSASDTKYISSGWNLNNFPRLAGSVLSYEHDDISGVLVPWLYIGMCFSTFCWHVEDHYLYSLSYMHWGAPKLWYGVPGSDAVKLEAAMRKHLPDLFEEQPDLLHKLVTQLSPSILKSEGVPVYRCVQNRGEFVMTFPRAYHAGLNCGFNCAEAVNIAPVDWLLHGQKAIELYRQQCRKTSISHDKLLLGAAREAVKAQWDAYFLRKTTFNNIRWKDFCGGHGLLSKALKTRVEMERANRELLCKSSQALKMESSFDANCDKECCVCFFDLHFSAVGCHHCSPDKYACLNHAKQLCSCSLGAKFYLFRYDMNELNILVEALEGKMSAVYRWARLDLGLSLTSCVSKGSTLVSGIRGKPFPSLGLPEKETNALPVSTGPMHIKVEGDSEAERGRDAEQKKSQHMDEVKLSYEDGEESKEVNAHSRSTQCSQAVFTSQCGRNISNQHIHQIDSPFASVARRVDEGVQPLDFGSLHGGKLWSDSQAIYPSGFRSRVRYISVLQPTSMCYYISQIMDVGQEGPLFTVYVEHCPSEVFFNTSAARCWDMVRVRVNQEIAKQDKVGKMNLPPLQPPGSLDGMQMFGFSTPSIIQTIQAMDQQQICSEYWKAQPPIQQIPQENSSNTRHFSPQGSTKEG